MKECIKEAIDNFICRLKEISKLFKVKLEGGDEVSLIIEGADNIKYKIVCVENMFNLDYTAYIPVKQDGKYSKWTPATLSILGILADINNILTKSSVSKSELAEYIIYKESNVRFQTLNQNCYSYAN